MAKKTARELLIDAVLAQIVEDVNSGDLTVIEELISELADEKLQAFLSEENQDA